MEYLRNLLKSAELYSRRTRENKENKITVFYENLKKEVLKRFNLTKLTDDEDMFCYLVAREASKSLNNVFKYTPKKVVDEFIEFMDIGYFEKTHYVFYDISIDNEQNLPNPLFPNKEYEDLRIYDETYGYYPLAIEKWGSNVEAIKNGQNPKDFRQFVEFVFDVVEYGDTNFTEDERSLLLQAHGYDPVKACADLQMYHNVQARKRTLALKQAKALLDGSDRVGEENTLAPNPAMLGILGDGRAEVRA